MAGAGARAVAVRSLADPARVRLDPGALLAAFAEVAAALAARGPSLATALASEPDYDASAMAAAATMVSEASYGTGAAFQKLVDDVEARRAGGGATAAAPAAATASLDLSLPFPPPPDPAAAYAASLADTMFGEWDSSPPGAFSRALVAASVGAPPLGRAAAKRIAKELRELAANAALSPDASIFVRTDTGRADRLRALVTGPSGTPYFGGCFVFDVLFPPAYPDVPPLVLLDTTGGGRARFNPNLYADGKVCLSLLGTWHGSHASEKWDAASANVWRVLVSIQSMILVADPYFNEPGVEAVRGTPEGDAAAARYNAKLALHVLRHAINGVIDAPPAGFADVVVAHFRGVRHALLAAAGEWLASAAGAADADTVARMREEVAGMKARLEKL